MTNTTPDGWETSLPLAREVNYIAFQPDHDVSDIARILHRAQASLLATERAKFREKVEGMRKPEVEDTRMARNCPPGDMHKHFQLRVQQCRGRHPRPH